MKQSIVITGAGGTVGMSLIKHFLKFKPEIEIRAIERSEKEICSLITLAENHKNLKVFLSDLINYSDMEGPIEGSDIIIHCAALKSIITSFVFPEELAYQNIACFCNVVKAAKKYKVKKILLCSTDKSAVPTSVMGASKLLLERIACFSSDEFSKFSAVRFGNILNSSGSVMPRVVSRLYNGEEININHRHMTRYIMAEDDFIKLINYAIDNMQGGEIFIPKARSLKIYDLIMLLVDLFSIRHRVPLENIKVKILNNPYFENINEKMINIDEVKFLYEYRDYFILKLPSNPEMTDSKIKNYGNLLSSSNGNLSKKELKKLIKNLKCVQI